MSARDNAPLWSSLDVSTLVGTQAEEGFSALTPPIPPLPEPFKGELFTIAAEIATCPCEGCVARRKVGRFQMRWINITGRLMIVVGAAIIAMAIMQAWSIMLVLLAFFIGAWVGYLKGTLHEHLGIESSLRRRRVQPLEKTAPVLRAWVTAVHLPALIDEYGAMGECLGEPELQEGAASWMLATAEWLQAIEAHVAAGTLPPLLAHWWAQHLAAVEADDA